MLDEVEYPSDSEAVQQPEDIEDERKRKHRDTERARHNEMTRLMKQLNNITPGKISDRDTQVNYLKRTSRYLVFLHNCKELEKENRPLDTQTLEVIYKFATKLVDDQCNSNEDTFNVIIKDRPTGIVEQVVSTRKPSPKASAAVKIRKVFMSKRCRGRLLKRKPFRRVIMYKRHMIESIEEELSTFEDDSNEEGTMSIEDSNNRLSDLEMQLDSILESQLELYSPWAFEPAKVVSEPSAHPWEDVPIESDRSSSNPLIRLQSMNMLEYSEDEPAVLIVDEGFQIVDVQEELDVIKIVSAYEEV